MRLALVRAHDTTDLDFQGFYFEIRGWEDGYLKIEDVTFMLPIVEEGQEIPKFETMFDFMKSFERL